jgi:hypothetical protein
VSNNNTIKLNQNTTDGSSGLKRQAYLSGALSLEGKVKFIWQFIHMYCACYLNI